jgi:SLOG cluster3 family
MNPVFLSASVPDPRRDPKFFRTADIVAIRDAVTALMEVALPGATVYFGGHPAITPMVRRVAERLKLLEKVALFQSREFEKSFPRDNRFFPNLRLADDLNGMRDAMLNTERFSAAVFIGGMEGVENEWRRVEVLRLQRGIPMFPLASTGGAALLLWESQEYPQEFRTPLRTDFNYVPLFRKLLRMFP